MKKNLFYILVSIFLVNSASVFSQQEYTLHFSRDLIQSIHTNPAIRTKHKFTLALPSAVFNFGNDAFSYNDLVKKRAGLDSTYLDIDGVIDKMDDENILQIQSEFDVFGLYYSVKDWYFSFFLTEKFDFRLNYPKDLIDLVWNGNAKFIGETIEIGPGVKINYLKEINLGVGREIGKWNFGLNTKLISGIANINSVKDQLSLTTSDDNYATTLSTDYEIRTSGTENPLKQLFLPPKNFENPGIGFDFGAIFRLNDKWEFSQSLLDVGMVKWKRDVVIYKSNGSFTYSGVDIAEFIDDKEVYFDDFRDSIKALYFDEQKGGTYVDYLVPETYTSGLFKPDDKTYLGALLHFSFFSGIQAGFSLYAGRDLMKFLNLGLSYSIKNNRFDNVGLNLNIGPRAFRFFIATDNLLNTINYRSGYNITWRYGININIGKTGAQTGRPEVKSEEEVPESTE